MAKKQMRIKDTTKKSNGQDHHIDYDSCVDKEWQKEFNESFDDTVQSVNILADDDKKIIEKMTLHDFHTGIKNDTKRAIIMEGMAITDYLDNYLLVRGFTQEEYLNALESKCDFYRARGIEMDFFYTFIRGILDKNTPNKDFFALKYLPDVLSLFLVIMPKIIQISSGWNKVMYVVNKKKYITDLSNLIRSLYVNMEEAYSSIFKVIDIVKERDVDFELLEKKVFEEEFVSDLANIIYLYSKVDYVPDILLISAFGMTDVLDVESMLYTECSA